MSWKGDGRWELIWKLGLGVNWKLPATVRQGLALVKCQVTEMVVAWGATGDLPEIATALNLRGIRTSRGCQFTPTHIHRLLKTA